jgi:hypothetical protein
MKYIGIQEEACLRPLLGSYDDLFLSETLYGPEFLLYHQANVFDCTKINGGHLTCLNEFY